MKKECIYLIGFMGTGKSTVSHCLGRDYHMKEIEMDEQIVREEGRSIADIFAREGEEYFRQLETTLLQKLPFGESVVVSCGGGTATRACNVQEMKKRGVVVLLDARPETIYERVRGFHNRPLLEGNMNVEYIQNLMEKRRPCYEKAADVIIHTDEKSAEEICMEIMEKIKQEETIC